MAADPKKKQEQEVQTPPVPQDSTPAPQPAPTISSEEQELIDSNNQLLEATKASNQASINSVADFIGEYERQKQAKIAEDETLRKREEAYRYITGLGDTLSGIANLVGVAHGAANQPQKYNSSEFMRKAEEARAKRKQNMEDLDKKIQEQRARLSQVKSAASLQEAQLQAKAQKEQAELRRSLAKEAEEKRRYEEGVAWKKSETERAQDNADRVFAENQRQFNENQERLTEQAAAENASREAIKQKELDARLAAQAAKNAADPKYQAQVLQSNITGIRDEIARSMGYTSYNDYLRYQNVTGWGKDLDGKRNKETKRIREERAARNPEAKDFLDKLRYPESLTEQDIRMLMGASKVFSDAVNSTAVAESGAGAEAGGQTPKTASGRDWSNRKDSSGGA